jgi:hypothetical protein
MLSPFDYEIKQKKINKAGVEETTGALTPSWFARSA